MKRHLITIGVAALIVGGLLVINRFEPQRVTEQAILKAQQAQAEIAKGEGIETQISASPLDAMMTKSREARLAAKAEETTPTSDSTTAATPASEGAFKVKFECSNGTFVAEFYPEWAPIGAAHMKELVENKVFDDAAFFRVIAGFMAQFGVPADPKVSAKWSSKNIQGEPVLQKNVRGMISYGMQPGNLNSRSTQLFINFGDNSFLDKSGFSPIGRVIEGMDVVDALNSEYGDPPPGIQDQMKARGNDVLRQQFPNLDYIKTARIISNE